MDTTIDGFADSYEISSTSFVATDNTDSSIVYLAAEQVLTGPDVSALQLLSNSFESVFDSPDDFYSDAKLVLSDGREVSFHRCVLSARSSFFKNALTAAKKEKDSNNTAVKLELKEIAKDYEVGFDSVVTVLAYVYSSRVRPPPKGVSECADENCCHVACRPAVDFMLEVLYLAFIFKIPELITLYQRHLLDVVDKVVIEDTLVILKLANICGKACMKLLDRCKEIIVKSNVDMVSLEKSLPEELVKEIIDRRKELGLEVPKVKKHVWNVHKALDSDDIELVKLLLKEDHTNLDDACALHFAVAYCNVKTATDLLKLDLADVNHRNPRGYTVLHVAAMRKEPQLILSLLEKGASASEATLEGRTALMIAKQATMAVECNNIPEQCKHSLKGRLCVEILEQEDKREPIPRDVPPSFAVAADELKMTLLDLENRVALAQRLFPTEAQAAMEIAEMKGTCEFIVTSLEPDRLTGTKRTSPGVKIAPFRILEEHQSRLKALSKTVELGKRFFPRCSAVLDQIMNCEDLTQLACGEDDTAEKRLQKKQRKGKKIATETEDENEEDKRVTLKVTQVAERPDRISPIVAYFSTGYDPCKVDPKTGKRVHETPKVTVYKHKDDSKKRIQVVVSPPGARVEFVGTNYTGEQAAMQTNTYRVGVFNREAKTLRILPVAHNKIIRLEPRVKAQETNEEEASGSAVVKELEELKTGERDRYNTKKAVTRDKKKRALYMGDDAATQKVLDGKLSELDVNTAALEGTSSTVARNIPPYNTAATTANEAYPLEKIIEKGDWSFLEDIYWLLQQETEAATEAYPVFVRNRLYRLRDIKDDMKKQTVCGAATLLTHLVKFKDRNSMNGYDSAKDHKMPDIFRQKFNSMFKDSESERIPVDKINLLISYVLVLSLHVDNFMTDPEDIAKDLRTSTVELRKHFLQLGCKFLKQNSTTVATLPTPLNFPEVNRRRRARK